MKQTIKKAAVDLFYLRGYYGTGMTAIADRAGIQKASIYHHYNSKEDILLDIFTTTMDELDACLGQSLKGRKTALEQILAGVRAHVGYHIDHYKQVHIADSELRGLTGDNHITFIDRRNNYEQRFLNIIEQGMADGSFKSGDAHILNYAVLTMCTAVSAWYKPGGRLSKDSIADIFTEFVLSGLINPGPDN